MDRKIIFIDIDGTLTVPLEKPTELTAYAVKRAREKGHKVFVCTGRNMPIIGEEILDIGFDGVVASAGAYIEVEGIPIFDDMMSESKVEKCLDIFHDEHVFCRLEDKNGIYIDEEMEQLLRITEASPENSELIRMQKEMHRHINIQSFEQFKRTGAYKICFTCTNLDYLKVPREMLEKEFLFVIHPFLKETKVFNGEIIRRGLDKGKGMQRVCDSYGMSIEDTIAFGDGMNDLQALQMAKIGIAMGNACEELKAAADLICKSVIEEGIYNAFKSLELI